MPSSERVKRGGFTFTVWQLSSGRWAAGAEGSSAVSREAAITGHLAHARCRPGSDAILTPAHKATARHRNAVAWDAHKRTSRV